ncbi:phosphotransferase family protein [Pseudooceanicola sp.]|uniref:phosphotransferase family protein n=1 Tax=Pseudooceanicola sp. TaxID=1914328 RepID=UPI002628968C|nr:phosphotransferase family protein [Pseudooceanicola sp.]MDF1855376.1 phosphotransferase family protein [Pseudooceanicola sp.]
MANSDPTKLDIAAVEKYLSDRIEGFSGPLTAEKFANGQSNPTFKLTSPTGQYVLRRKPPGELLKSAHAVDREFRVQSALWTTDVPVAKMYFLSDDDNVVGSQFYVMEAVEGRNINAPSMPEVPFEQRKLINREMARVLSCIHGVDLAAVGLSDYGPEGNYYRRQIDRWTKQYRASQTDDLPEMEELMTWLDTNIPAEDGLRTLAHGDYRIDNMLFHKTDPRCVAVLDWELSTTGHPYADVAAVIMQWQMPEESRGLAGVDRKAVGIMEDQEFIDAYCEERGIAEIPQFNFYLAFTFFRMAGILQGIKKRLIDGTASNPQRAKQAAEGVPEFVAGGLAAARAL